MIWGVKTPIFGNTHIFLNQPFNNLHHYVFAMSPPHYFTKSWTSSNKRFIKKTLPTIICWSELPSPNHFLSQVYHILHRKTHLQERGSLFLNIFQPVILGWRLQRCHNLKAGGRTKMGTLQQPAALVETRLAPKSRINGSLDCNHSSAAYLHSNVTGQSKTPICGDRGNDIFWRICTAKLDQKWLLFDGKKIESQRDWWLHWLYSWNGKPPDFAIETMSVYIDRKLIETNQQFWHIVNYTLVLKFKKKQHIKYLQSHAIGAKTFKTCKD